MYSCQNFSIKTLFHFNSNIYDSCLNLFFNMFFKYFFDVFTAFFSITFGLLFFIKKDSMGENRKMIYPQFGGMGLQVN